MLAKKKEKEEKQSKNKNGGKGRPDPVIRKLSLPMVNHRILLHL